MTSSVYSERGLRAGAANLARVWRKETGLNGRIKDWSIEITDNGGKTTVRLVVRLVSCDGTPVLYSAL